MPACGTKNTHPIERNLFKACVLAVQYGMGADSLALRINVSLPEAMSLLKKHRDTFEKFWSWQENILNKTMLTGQCSTVYGWQVQVPAKSNSRSLSNFPMQANGSEMLRLACNLLVEAGIKICAPVHDAILIECKTENVGREILIAQNIMENASEIILDGFKLRSDVKIFSHPDRFQEDGAGEIWDKIVSLIENSHVGPV